MWMPDRRSERPVYLQIADMLENQIADGEYPSGSRLPSERKLADRYKVNRSTVILAYSVLRSKGLIETRPGSGTLVSKYEPDAAAVHTPSWQQYAESGSFLPNWPLLRRIRETLGHNPDMIDFSSGKLSLDMVPTAAINRIIREYRYDPGDGFDNPQGYPALRRALVAFLDQYRGIRTTEASILITTGSQQSLYLITQCLLSPGDAVGVEDPSFFRSLSMFQSAGLRLFRLPVDEGGLSPDGIRTLHRKNRIKMLFVHPNFQNPTGTLLAEERRAELLAVASELGLPLVEDDPLSLTAYDGRIPPPLKAFDAAASTLYIGSFSKIAAPGLRIGWIVAPQPVIQRLADARWIWASALSRSILPHNSSARRSSLPIWNSCAGSC